MKTDGCQNESTTGIKKIPKTANTALINKRKRKERKTQTRNGGHSAQVTLFFFATMLKMLVMSSFSLTFTATSTI